MDALLFINPGLYMMAFGFVALFIPHRRIRQAITIIAPLFAMFVLMNANHGIDKMIGEVLGLRLILYHVEGISLVFGIAFIIASILNAIYAWHTDDRVQDGTALMYAGSAVTATFCGDLMSLFIFWELTAVTSVFLILKAGTRAAYFASMRYLAIQILSGVLLLDGIAYVFNKTGDITIQAFTSLNEPGAMFIFLAVGIKAAFPFMHNWLQDSYPKATVTGAVILSAFTTKLAVLTLARLFPGHDVLIWIGAIMTVFRSSLPLLKMTCARCWHIR
jgi:multicomponent Na+:H+ antiporter subunit D